MSHVYSRTQFDSSLTVESESNLCYNYKYQLNICIRVLVMNTQTTTLAEDKRYFQIADMTDKERRILAMLVLGFSIDEMAADLCISTNYVYMIIRQLRVRFLARTNTAVVVRALGMGLITAEGQFLM